MNMARAFDISPLAPTVKLDASRTGVFEFKVSNALGKKARARFRPVPEKSTDPTASWFSPDPPDQPGQPSTWEKDLTSDETALFRVRVRAPSSAPTGDYQFHASVANVANPDEEYADGPPVTFTVPLADVKPFPWWIVAVAAAVVVVGGLVAFLLLHHGNKQVAVGSTCAADSDCSSNQKCTAFSAGAKACLLKPQEACLQDRDCTSFWCSAKKCSRDDGHCDPATAATDCRAPVFACAANLCVKANGQPCATSPECQSGACNAGTCGPPVTSCPIVCPFGTRCINSACVRVFFEGNTPFRFDSSVTGKIQMRPQ
jgi:hypothetical protein